MTVVLAAQSVPAALAVERSGAETKVRAPRTTRMPRNRTAFRVIAPPWRCVGREFDRARPDAPAAPGEGELRVVAGTLGHASATCQGCWPSTPHPHRQIAPRPGLPR